MKLFSTIFCAGAANAANVKCMAKDNPTFAGDPDNSPIEMYATVNNNEIKHDLTQDADWECSGDGENAVCTRSWGPAEFTEPGEMTFDGDNLVLKKSIEADCKSTDVDEVTVCLQTGHKLDFTCKYPLGTQTIKSDFDVSGHDTNVSKEGVGKLNYVLTASGSGKIGEKVDIKVTAVNQGLVYHALQDCQVEHDGESVSILNWNEEDSKLMPVCPNVLEVDILNAVDQAITGFSFNAFKWSTSTQDDDKEVQTIKCTISLTENSPTVATRACPEIFPGEDCAANNIRGRTKYGVKSIEECIEHCQVLSSLGCNAVTWTPQARNSCWPKNNNCDNHRAHRAPGIMSARLN